MVAYSFQKRFLPKIVAGLEPGPWLPGMKRHTMRQPRSGRSRHARPGETIQLYTGMRTKHCRQVGRVRCIGLVPMCVAFDDAGDFLVFRCRDELGGEARGWLRDYEHLAQPVRHLLENPPELALNFAALDAFAQADGFDGAAAMAAFFASTIPDGREARWAHLDLVLIAWAPLAPHGLA